MSTTYSAELVAPALAGLSATQLANLVDQGTFGEWLGRRISSTSEADDFSPDSQEASEAAGAAGDAEYQATQVLATLSEEQQESLKIQAFGHGEEVSWEIADLMPV
jgi:hypothetical protein